MKKMQSFNSLELLKIEKKINNPFNPIICWEILK